MFPADSELKGQVTSRYSPLETSIESRARAIQADNSGGILGDAITSTFGGSSPDPEAMQSREDVARDAYERIVKQEKRVQERLDREVTALNALTETYTKQLSDHLNRRAQIARLQIHLKSNIMSICRQYGAMNLQTSDSSDCMKSQCQNLLEK